ncbi:uncharacterized protein METZ01_LOCUS445971 [marine metagenome]|uniref:Uncharacterized protein n=1 Tax=marine metagenome TaxID=408172 RepID=A0A382ZC97_9ZZZZ
MPRSSRGSTSHRGHRTRGRHNEIAQQATRIATPQEATNGPDITTEQPAVPSELLDRVAKSAPQRAVATISGTSLQANPLLTKELIRISVLATVVLALLTAFTSLLK